MKIAFLLVCFWAIGCYGTKRDHIQDPFNTPQILLHEAAYQPAQGHVKLHWEYLGQRPISQFLIVRRHNNAFQPIGTVPSQNTKRIEGIFEDPTIFSGEQVTYQIIAENVESGNVETEPVSLSIPGLQLNNVITDPLLGRVQISWTGSSETLASYEIIRSHPQGTETTIYQSKDLNQTQVFDSDILGNTTYTYFIKNTMQTGAQLQSRTAQTSLYTRLRQHQIDITSNEQIIFLPTTHIPGASHLRYKEQTNGITIETLRTVPTTPHLRNLQSTTIPLENLQKGSLSGAITPTTNTSLILPRIFVSALNAQTKQVIIKPFNLPQLLPAFWQNNTWTATPNASQTAIAIHPQGHIFISAGHTLKIFDEQSNELNSFTLSTGQPSALHVIKDVLWATFPNEGILAYAQITALLSGTLNWTTVSLPENAKPSDLIKNQFDQAVVLDSAQQHIYIFNADGTPNIHWPLTNITSQPVAITSEATGNPIYVIDTSGDIFAFGE